MKWWGVVLIVVAFVAGPFSLLFGVLWLSRHFGLAGDIAILVAIVGLVSTIVGAAIGAVTNYVVAERRERADRARDSRIHAIEVKRAARLNIGELLRAQAAAATAIDQRKWWSVDVARLSTDMWQKHSGTIAADLSDEDWGALENASMAADHLRGARDQVDALGQASDPISDAQADMLAPLLGDIRLGHAALAPVTSLPIPP